MLSNKYCKPICISNGLTWNGLYGELSCHLQTCKIAIQGSFFIFFVSLLFILENVLAQMVSTVVLSAHREGCEWKHFLCVGSDYPQWFSFVLLNITRAFHSGNLHSLIMPQMCSENFATWKSEPWKLSLTLKHFATKSPWGLLPSPLIPSGKWSKAFACYNSFYSESLPNIDFLLNQTEEKRKGEATCIQFILGLDLISVISRVFCRPNPESYIMQ